MHVANNSEIKNPIHEAHCGLSQRNWTSAVLRCRPLLSYWAGKPFPALHEAGQFPLRGRGRGRGRAGGVGSQVALSVERRGEGGVVQRAGHGSRALVGGHAAQAVLRLIRGQLAPQLLRQDVGLQETGFAGQCGEACSGLLLLLPPPRGGVGCGKLWGLTAHPASSPGASAERRRSEYRDPAHGRRVTRVTCALEGGAVSCWAYQNTRNRLQWRKPLSKIKTGIQKWSLFLKKKSHAQQEIG